MADGTDALIVSHVGKAKALGRRLSRRYDDRDEIVAEALLELVIAAHSYRDGHGATFWTWARLKIHYRLLERRRSEMRRAGWVRKQGPDGRELGWTRDYMLLRIRERWDDDEAGVWDHPDPAPSPEHQAITADMRRRYLAVAKDDGRRRLAERVLDGMTHADAGSASGCSGSWVSQVIRDMTQRVRE